MEQDKQIPICSQNCPHYPVIKEVKDKEPTREQMTELSEIFKLFADDTRLRIIYSILNRELCVCDLCEILGLNQSAVSHQLQLLRRAKLVKYRREGKQIYYSLEDAHVEAIIQMAFSHILEKKEEG